MRYVLVPIDILVTNPFTKMPLLEADGVTPHAKTFGRVCTETWLNDRRGIEGNVNNLRRWMKMSEKLEASKPGDVVELEDQDWQKLKQIVEEPSQDVTGSYGARVWSQLLPFIDAVLEAPTTKPSPALPAMPEEPVTATA